ncbi:Sugar-specific transcriptional regulator TrmB [Actinacidiphila yanglinensis]|uniref:Sugar-specific transcriptional regulator TrmB n=1 Tax=Actinacidiphila yanglinensis TaxID=310779 RepID=A0A1H6DSK4_9ACTN|nr:LuxR C-terminal-related transcriptional regulator [Actinacidiphila yanglinensis]SEG87693.1 Sugar-specific transcriptional regulator TrmB [Actinacidiphila yanglinensis]
MLEVIGLDSGQEAAYFVLLDGAPLRWEELVGRSGLEPEAARGALTRLEERGLVARLAGQPARWTTLPPEHAIEVLLLARERDIRRVRGLAQRLGEKHRAARIGQGSAALVEVINGPEAVARCGQQVFTSAAREVRGIDAPPYAQAADGTSVNSSANLASRGVRSRFIHGRENLTLPGTINRIERDIAHGEEVRVLPRAPMKLILADDQAGLVPLVATPEVLDSAILVRPSSLLDALSELFETLWQQAQPYILDDAGPLPDGDGPTSDERRILSLLAVGLSDEAIARQLGLGLRTVQRRVRALLERLGASSRFQAGVLAADRGWWRPRE